MAKKDFSNVSTGAVYDTITAATSETEQTQETQQNKRGRKPRNAHDTQDTINDTQGNQKNDKLQRINMAFDDDTYTYIKIMSRVSGMTMTEFCNVALRQHMKDHDELYRRAIEFRNSL